MRFQYICRVPGKTGRYGVVFKDGILAELQPLINHSDGTKDLWLTRGLFDIQVNGMLGYNLSEADLTPERVLEIDNELAKHGILRWCPTLTTQNGDVVTRNLGILREVIEKGPASHIQCIHLEGHYISAEDGYRGVHMKQFIRDPDAKEFDLWQKTSGDHIGLFSLAPERKGAIEFIRKLKTEGVRVALVHHNASHDQVQQAAASGADLSSHLVNGCAKMIHRQHNVIWSQLALDELWASFIADGYHIPHYTLKAVIQAKGLHRTILISDLAHLSGLPDGEYSKNELTVVVQDGGLWVKGEGTNLLSGAVKTLDQDCAFLASRSGFSIEQSLTMATRNPARYFGIEQEFDIFPGARGRFALFAWDGENLDVEYVLK
jgi:N-acetylglucosamine-6-phosphate deacetylase